MGTSKGSKGKKLALNKETLKRLIAQLDRRSPGWTLKGLTGAACSDPCPATKLLLSPQDNWCRQGAPVPLPGAEYFAE